MIRILRKSVDLNKCCGIYFISTPLWVSYAITFREIPLTVIKLSWLSLCDSKV